MSQITRHHPSQYIHQSNMSYFASQSTPTLGTSASASSLQHDELDIVMSCYTDCGAMELDPEESFSPDIFWDDDAGDSDGNTVMNLFPYQRLDNCHTSTDSSDSLHTADTFREQQPFALRLYASTSTSMMASISSCFLDPSDTSNRNDKKSIAQALHDLEQKLAASMKRSEASRARILELK
mmetsp:Transcript_9322/g.26212  ORF Transcript_9322/g.26212 Transcript_9322/m.26212 type:complete len:181 (-) Transcript_9322:118-660(-)